MLLVNYTRPYKLSDKKNINITNPQLNQHCSSYLSSIYTGFKGNELLLLVVVYFLWVKRAALIMFNK